MLQFIPETAWSFWQLFGTVVSLPFVFYYLSKVKDWIPIEKFEDDVIPIGFLGKMLVVVLTPPMLGETFAVIAGMVLYPELSIQTLLRGLRFFLVIFISMTAAYLGLTLHNRRKRKTREESMNLS